MNVIVEACVTGSRWSSFYNDTFVRLKMEDGTYFHVSMRTPDWHQFRDALEEHCGEFEETEYYSDSDDEEPGPISLADDPI